MNLKTTWILSLFLMLSFQLTYAQEKTISGVVTADGLPLPGATVVVEGTQRGTQSDLDGRYAIKVKAADRLIFSFIGMKDQLKSVGSATVLNVAMMDDAVELEGVIVTAYGQVKKKNEITGNVVAVSGDVIAKSPMASPDQALQGRVAGLQMSTSSGTPGSSQQIRIRGRNSINASNEPLFVIDGVPVTNEAVVGSSSASTLSPLASINNDDIESITVLKDAGATSVYGARGSNGVILITTKKGKAGTVRFSFNSMIGFQRDAVKGPRVLTGSEKKMLFEEAYYNSFSKDGSLFTKDQAYANLISDTRVPMSDKEELIQWVEDGQQEYNWGRLLANRDAPMQSASISATGGDDKTTFYTSLGFNKTEATVIGSDFKRISGIVNFTRKFNDRIDFKTSINVSSTQQNGISEQGSGFSNPYLTKNFMSPWRRPFNKDGSYYLPKTGYHNTLYVIQHDKMKNDLTRALVNNELSYKIAKDLKFTTNFSIDYKLASYSEFKNPIHGDGDKFKGTATNLDNKIFNYVTQNSLDYRFYLGDDHKFDAKVLMEFQKNKDNEIYAYGRIIPVNFDRVGTAAADKNANSDYNDWSQMGYVGILNYAFQNKYLIDATFRREGSSRFSKERRWGNFYSLGAAWNIHEEAFLETQDVLNTLRLRGSLGTTGNSNISLNSYQQLLSTYSYNNDVGWIPNQMGGDIGWEKQDKYDLGLEFGLIDHRITGSVAYYLSKTKDLLFSLPLPLTSGFESQMVNIGALENRGWEFELAVDVLRSNHVNWNVSANFATVQNEVTQMPSVLGKEMTVTTATTRMEMGHPIRGWYMKKYAGVDAADGNAMWYANGVDGETVKNYSKAESTWQGGSALPKYSGGVSTRLDAFNFFLSATLYYAGGHKVYEDWAGNTWDNSRMSLATKNGVEGILDRWQKPGDVTDMPKVEYISTANNDKATAPSTRFLYDGDYLRLRDVSLGYNFNAEALKQLQIDGLTLSVSGTNLFTWVKDSRLKHDPEVRADGVTRLNSPAVKTVVFSLNVKF